MRPSSDVIAVLGDIHGGMRGNWKDKRKPALHDFLDCAGEMGCTTLCLAGDIGDNRGKRQSEWEKLGVPKPRHADRFYEHMADIRSLLDKWRRNAALPVHIVGNHDGWEHFSPDEMEAHLGPHRRAPGLVHVDESGLVVTHGHAFESPRLLGDLLPLLNRGNYVRLLATDPTFRQEMVRVLKRCDIGDKVGTMLAPHGLEGLGEALTNGIENLIQLARYLVDNMLNRNDRKSLLWSRTAALLAASLDSQAVAYGHTHLDDVRVQEVVHPHTHQSVEVLVGNCGSFVQGDPTCLLIKPRERTMSVLKWTKKKGVKVKMSARLKGKGRGFNAMRDQVGSEEEIAA